VSRSRAGVFGTGPPPSSEMCAQTEVVLVRGGNSARQAAVFLPSTPTKVFILVRGPGLAASMVTLSDRPHRRHTTSSFGPIPNWIDFTATFRQGLTAVSWRNNPDKRGRTAPGANVFSVVGADPGNRNGSRAAASGWTQNGFVVTGQATAGCSATDTCRPRSSPLCPACSRSAKYSPARSRRGGFIGEAQPSWRLIHQHLAATHSQPP